MDDSLQTSEKVCLTQIDTEARIREKLPEVTDHIINHCNDEQCFTHIDHEPIPSEGYVVDIIDKLKQIIFPGYFTREKLDPVNLKYTLGRTVTALHDMLSEQIAHNVRHDCLRYDLSCTECETRGQKLALALLESIPSIRKTMAEDVRAAFEGDPAAKSYDEIIFTYPGVFAVTVYRIAHRLFELGVPLLPRSMTEHAHSVTGIDIHPGATIGERFVIDHGTGVVIGETTEIGNNVRIYQGVTLGALSLPRDAGDLLRGSKRHPTIEDDVIIYAGATILGGETVIGARSVIGGNVWITESVPPDNTVVLETPKLIYKSKNSDRKGIET
jgi:serine O-acetyltransferase